MIKFSRTENEFAPGRSHCILTFQIMEAGVVVMNSLAKMKAQLAELEDRRNTLSAQIETATRDYKIGLWTMVAGAFLIPVYGIGLLVVIAGGYIALANGGRRTRAQDQLDQAVAEINKLKLSMV